LRLKISTQEATIGELQAKNAGFEKQLEDNSVEIMTVLAAATTIERR
jgi:hypothetical protein